MSSRTTTSAPTGTGSTATCVPGSRDITVSCCGAGAPACSDAFRISPRNHQPTFRTQKDSRCHLDGHRPAHPPGVPTELAEPRRHGPAEDDRVRGLHAHTGLLAVA